MEKKLDKLDRGALAVICLYVVQWEGRPTVDEVAEVIAEKLKYRVAKKKVADAVEALQKKGLVSVNYDTDEEKRPITRYSVSRVKWAKPLEIAHLTAILPSLLETEEAKEILAMLDSSRADGKRKSQDGPDITDYRAVCCKYRVATPMLGTEPYEKARCRFPRVDGKLWLKLNLWMKGALKIKLRMKGIVESKVRYIEVEDVFMQVDPKKDLGEEQSFMGNCGATIFESLKQGHMFSTVVRYPTKGFMPEKDFLECLNVVRLGSRHKDFGLCILESVKFVDVFSSVNVVE